MRVHLNMLGCRLNEAELETWSRDFQARGHQITNDPALADLVVLNTCAVTSEAVRKSRKIIHRLARQNPNAKLVVSGCYTSLDAGDITQSEGVDLVVNNQEKDRLVEIVTNRLNLNVIPETATVGAENSLFARGRQRAFVKVQDGCRYQCTFCIVTEARGEERSRSVSDVVNEINNLYRDGIQEAVLTGVHLGGYGSDNNSNLYLLIKAVIEETEIPRLRLGALEPWDLPERLFELYENPRFMPHLHLPLQSGADTVLRRMARRCKSAEFEQLIVKARREIPDFNIATDIIVGFPGETESEWRETMAFIEKIGFGHLHIFKYSPRPGTRAASMLDRISRDVMRCRSQELHQLGERMKRENQQSYIGRTFPVLIEGRKNNRVDLWHGYTPNFLPVTIISADKPDHGNTIAAVRLLSIAESGDRLIGEIH